MRYSISFLAPSLDGEESLGKLKTKFSYPDSDSDLHQNRINSSVSHTQPVRHIFWRYPAHRKTNRQANRQTGTVENTTSATKMNSTLCLFFFNTLAVTVLRSCIAGFLDDRFFFLAMDMKSKIGQLM